MPCNKDIGVVVAVHVCKGDRACINAFERGARLFGELATPVIDVQLRDGTTAGCARYEDIWVVVAVHVRKGDRAVANAFEECVSLFDEIAVPVIRV